MNGHGLPHVRLDDAKIIASDEAGRTQLVMTAQSRTRYRELKDTFSLTRVHRGTSKTLEKRCGG